MSLIRCQYCEQSNPAEARFCNACGGALRLPPHLASCPRCGTVNPVTTAVCCWCRAQLPGHRERALVPVSPAAEVSRSLPRRRSRVIVGTAVVAAIAVLGYYTYRRGSLAGAPQPAAASSEASGRGAPGGAGFIGRDAAAGVEAAIKRPQTTGAGNAGGQEPPHPQTCTEAVAALGLCAPIPTPRRE